MHYLQYPAVDTSRMGTGACINEETQRYQPAPYVEAGAGIDGEEDPEPMARLKGGHDAPRIATAA